MNGDLGFTAVEDLSVAFRRAGEGPPLVLLHGFLCDSRCWRTQLTGLADRFTVIAWDAPGAGASSDPPTPFTFDDWSRCLAAFLDALGVERADFVGMSWGGTLAQEFYRIYPSRVSRLILAGTYAGWKGSLSADIADQRWSRCERDSHLSSEVFVARWVPEMFSETASAEVHAELATIFADFHPDGFRMMAKSLADTDTTGFLPGIGVPTLLLWGERDRRSPPSIAEQMNRAIPGAELGFIAGAGHLSNMEQPDAFNARVRDFCRAG